MKRFFTFSWGLMLGFASMCAQVEVRVEPLIGKEAITAPIPVRVELRNHGTATRGALEWRLSDDILCLIPVELPPNARKQVELAVPVNAWQRTASKQREPNPVPDVPKLFWREAGKKGVQLPVPFNLNFRLPLVVIGDVQGGFEAWRRATYTLEYRFLGVPVDSSEGWRWTPVYLRPEQAPANPLTLRGVPAIVLTEGCERLRTEQWDALIYWMLSGGHLIVSAGSLSLSLNQTPLRSLMPATGKRVRVRLLEPIRPFGLSPPKEPVVLVQAQSPPGWRTYRSGDHLIACQTRVGLGMLTLFWGDWTATAWRGWASAPLLASDWTAVPEPPTLKLRDALPRRSPWQLITLRQAATVSTLFAVYWLALLPLWRVMRRLRWLRYAPLAILALVGISGIALVLTTPRPKLSSEPQVERHTIRHPNLLHTLILSRYRFTLTGGAQTLRLEPDAYLLTIQDMPLLEMNTRIHYLPPMQVHLQTQGKAQLDITTVQFRREAPL